MDSQVDERLAQPAEAMFERNVAHLARGGKEVAVRVDGQEPVVGFFSGMDEAFIQLCRTETQLQTLIDRTAIVAVDETGRTLAAYERSGELGEDALSRLRGRIRHFRTWAGVALASGQSVATTIQ